MTVTVEDIVRLVRAERQAYQLTRYRAATRVRMGTGAYAVSLQHLREEVIRRHEGTPEELEVLLTKMDNEPISLYGMEVEWDDSLDEFDVECES